MSGPYSRPSVTFKIGDQPIPGYRIVRELGRGTFGVVWLTVTDNGFERALKVVNLEQKGGKKEFRALRLIKDRKILHGNLLTLIDYWLLDRDGTILSSASTANAEKQLAPIQTRVQNATTAIADGASAKVNITNLSPSSAGTMMPGEAVGDAPLNVRDTFQASRMSDTTEDENSQAIWLIVAMELGHKTLHDRQKEHTAELHASRLTSVKRKGVTQFDGKDDTAAGSHTVADRKKDAPTQQDDDDLSPLPADEILPYMEQAARGLDYLHRCDIVHRDVKPQNIMLVGDVAKVCDYGLASELGDIRATTNAFTLPYAASEAINKNEFSPFSDQYSLAVTYVELRTGRWPFISNTSTAVYAAKDTGVHHLRFIRNRNVRAVLKKALSKKPQDRYSTCGEFVKQLSKAEAKRFNLFATAQAFLALLAIVAVLLAASATHPEVWKRIQPAVTSVANAVGFTFPPPPPPPPPTITAAEFRARLAEAEKRLHNDEDMTLAVSDFGQLQSQLPQTSGLDEQDRVDTYLGLARALAGHAEKIDDPALRETVKSLLDNLTGATALTDRQRIQSDYLHLVVLGDVSTPSTSPDDVEGALTNWEHELWRLKFNVPAPTDLEKLLRQIATHRHSKNFSLARAGLEELRTKLQVEPGPAKLVDQVDLEELHLSLSESSADPTHLQKLEEFLKEKIAAEKQLLDRARLLRLLVVSKSLPAPVMYLSPTVIPALNDLQLEPFPEPRMLQSSYQFSPDEVTSLLDVKAQITKEYVEAPTVMPTAAFDVFKRLYKTEETAKFLCDRLEYLLKQPLTAAQVVVIQNAAANLQTFIQEHKPWESLSGVKRVPMEKRDADLRLQATLLGEAPGSETGISGLVELVTRSSNPGKGVQQLIDRAAQPGWTKVVGPVVRDLLVHSSLKSASSQDLAKWRAQLESLSLQETWLTDPRDATAIAKIKSAVTEGFGANRGPLATLLLLECELPLPGAKIKELRVGLQSEIEEVPADAATEPLLAAYREFLLARVRAAATNSIDHSDAALAVVKLLSTEQPPSWLTPTRREALKEVLTVAAWDKLGLTDQDLLRFVDLSLETDSQLAEEMKAAGKAGLDVPALSGVAAVVAAIQGAKGADVSWETIRQQVAALRADAISLAIFERAGCTQLLRYVEALAAIKATPVGTDLKTDVVQAFHQVLFAEQGGSPLFFRHLEGATTQDEGVLRNLVNPLLSQQGKRNDLAGKKPAYAKELASIWGVKGRLLQRSPHIVHFEQAAAAETDAKKAATLALSLANAAFETALKLDYDDEYLVGFGRTLAGLPAEIKSYASQRKELNVLVRQHNPEGKSKHAGMQFLYAYVRKAEGYSSDNVSIIADATARYNEVRNRLPQEDPYDLGAIVCEGLSDLHLRQAFLTMHSKTTTSEVRALLTPGQKVPENSKAYHLSLAVEFAKEALTKAQSNSQDNAYLCLGNAYEDFAFYLGSTTHYAISHTHFDKSINESDARNRSPAKAKLNFGRSQFRYADDSLSSLATPLDRIRVFDKAIANLVEARDSKELLDGAQVECEFWLAKAYLGKAKLQSEADNPPSFKAALEHTRNAGSLAQQFKMPQSFYYEALKLEVETFRAMAVAKRDPANRAAVYVQMRPALEKAYQLFANDPKDSNAIIINALATHSREAWPKDSAAAGNVANRTRWTNGNAQIVEQWNFNDSWKYQAATLGLINSDLTSTRAVAIQKSRDIAGTIEDARIKQEALAKISDFEALVAFDSWEKSKVNATETTRAEVQAEARVVLGKLLKALQAHQNNLDADAADLLKRINEQAAINPGDIPSYEKKKLQRIVGSPDVGFRLNLLTAYLYVNSFDNSVTRDPDQVKTIRNCLNPLVAFKDSEFQGVANVQYKQRAQTALVVLNGYLNPGGAPAPKNQKQAVPAPKKPVN